MHKWPIRPGVHVHVNGLHVLNNSSSASGEITGFSYGARNSSENHSPAVAEKSGSVEDVAASKNTTTVARGTSTSDMMRHNETMAAASNNNGAVASAEAVNNSNFF